MYRFGIQSVEIFRSKQNWADRFLKTENQSAGNTEWEQTKWRYLQIGLQKKENRCEIAADWKAIFDGQSVEKGKDEETATDQKTE